MWPTSYDLTKLTAADEERIVALGERKAVSCDFAVTGPPAAVPPRRGRMEAGLSVATRMGLIRVHGARENNLRNISVEIPKLRLTVFTGVSARARARSCSTRSPRVATADQRDLQRLRQGFMPTLARPEVDVLEGLTTAIIVGQERMGGNAALHRRHGHRRRTRCCASCSSRLGQPHVDSQNAFSLQRPFGSIERRDHDRARCGRAVTRSFNRAGGMCQRWRRAGQRHR